MGKYKYKSRTNDMHEIKFASDRNKKLKNDCHLFVEVMLDFF